MPGHCVEQHLTERLQRSLEWSPGSQCHKAHISRDLPTGRRLIEGWERPRYQPAPSIFVAWSPTCLWVCSGLRPIQEFLVSEDDRGRRKIQPSATSRDSLAFAFKWRHVTPLAGQVAKAGLTSNGQQLAATDRSSQSSRSCRSGSTNLAAANLGFANHHPIIWRQN